MHLPLLQDFVIILAFSVLVVFLLQRFRLPSILGFLLTGILIGPHALGLVYAVEEIEVISEIGVILLLFVIGMELSIKQLMSIRKTVFIGGTLQVGLSVVVFALLYRSLGNTWEESVFVGFLFSLSSTAVVLTVFQQRDEISLPHGRNALGILIFQDIIVVPMMLLTPIIAGQSSNVTESLLLLLGKTLVVALITIVSARYLVPRLMHAIALTRSKELFLLTTMAICFTVAFLTSEAGLSLALGAFLAGLIISESEYSHQATGIMLPFRELFISFFFISIGMLLDLGFFLNNIGLILLLVLGVFVIKSVLASLATAVLRYPPRTFLVTGLALFQVGEFAFILSKVGIKYELLSPEMNQYFLAVSIFSMLLTPFVIIFAERIAFGLSRLKPMQVIDRKLAASPEGIAPPEGLDRLDNHLIIIGYGINGRNLARAARYNDIPYLVIDFNAETVRRERAEGVPILYGDATHEHLLETAHLARARAVVISISDPTATRTIIHHIRGLSQSLYLAVRTRYLREIPELIALGADDVIPEEFETSIELFSHVLHHFLVPESEIEHFAHKVREDNYELLQGRKSRPKTFRPTKFPEFNITCLQVNTDSGPLIGRALSDMDLRNEYGVNVLGIIRREEMLEAVSPEEVILRGDLLFVNGKQSSIEAFRKMIG